MEFTSVLFQRMICKFDIEEERRACEVTFASADERDSAAVCKFLYILA